MNVVSFCARKSEHWYPHKDVNTNIWSKRVFFLVLARTSCLNIEKLFKEYSFKYQLLLLYVNLILVDSFTIIGTLKRTYDWVLKLSRLISNTRSTRWNVLLSHMQMIKEQQHKRDCWEEWIYNTLNAKFISNNKNWMEIKPGE